jgi:hypothetical protein
MLGRFKRRTGTIERRPGGVDGQRAGLPQELALADATNRRIQTRIVPSLALDLDVATKEEVPRARYPFELDGSLKADKAAWYAAVMRSKGERR